MNLPALAMIISTAVSTADLCTLRQEYSQQDLASWLLVQTPENCRYRVSDLAATLEKSLGNVPAGTALRSIFIGRLISYPELSESLKELAASDVAWDKLRGKGLDSDNTVVVARLLVKSPKLAPLRTAIERRGYKLKAFSVEKVLVVSSDGSRLPCDALTWLVVERL